jgi:dipeptidyl aminopeptidase/acylaminoacyl peptidase
VAGPNSRRRSSGRQPADSCTTHVARSAHAVFIALILVLAATAAPDAAAQQAAPPAPSRTAGAAAAADAPLEAFLAYAFPTGLVAAPSAQRMAWLANDRGRRNVWLAEAPTWQPRRVTPYDEDDGRDLSALRFLPDGRRLVYLRGHTTNMEGEVANPTSDSDGASRDLWLVDAGGGEPVRIAGAVNAVIAPTGARMAWVHGRDAMLLDLDASPAAGPARLFTVRSSLGSLEWSPDGTRIAFISERSGRAILGMFDLRDRQLTWLTNSADRDALPRWSPDGSRIAFVRSEAGVDGFSVWSVDARPGGAARVLWRSPRVAPVENAPVAYPRAVTGSYDIMYGDGWIVVPGEWTGWNRLYAIPADGGEARELTTGGGIVENALLSPDRAWVWISTNSRGIDHRQLGRVRLRDGHAEWIEEGDVIAWSPAPFADGRSVAYLRADHAEHASVYRRDLTAPEPARISAMDPAFPLPALVRPEQVIFETQDGWTVHAQLFLPPQRRAGERHPGVLFLHGGSRRQMLLGWHYSEYYHHAYAFNQYLASQGYAVLSVNYRSGIGYGTAFRNAPDYGRSGASEYQDVIDGARWLQRHERVDPARIALWGGSYGGYLTALGLARNSDVFRAGVDIHGVHDWNESTRWYGRREPPPMFAAQTEQQRETAFRASPVADMATWTSPVLIVQGDDDRNVAFEASIDLVRRLRQKGDVHFEELYFIDEVHGFLKFATWLETFRASADFLDRMLRDPQRAAR